MAGTQRIESYDLRLTSRRGGGKASLKIVILRFVVRLIITDQWRPFQETPRPTPRSREPIEPTFPRHHP